MPVALVRWISIRFDITCGMENKDAHEVEWNRYTGDQALPIAHHESALGEIVSPSVVYGEITEFVTRAARECRCPVAKHVR